MEQPADLGLLQQLEQLVERDGRVVLDQAERGQRTGRFVRVADFRVDQFAGAEQLALAHDHAHEQCARRLRQGGEGGEESALVGGQQVAVALGDPREYAVEVIQVVKLVFQNCDHCRRVTVFIYSISRLSVLAQSIRAGRTRGSGRRRYLDARL